MWIIVNSCMRNRRSRRAHEGILITNVLPEQSCNLKPPAVTQSIHVPPRCSAPPLTPFTSTIYTYREAETPAGRTAQLRNRFFLPAGIRCFCHVWVSIVCTRRKREKVKRSSGNVQPKKTRLTCVCRWSRRSRVRTPTEPA